MSLFIGHPKEPDLALFAGGELGPLSRWRIERHLQQCDGCQDAVADFFHLQSEVSELAQTPAVDWKALAHNIAVRVSLDAPGEEAKQPGWFAHPRIWQAGLATATLLCTIVVVRQLPTVEDSAIQAVPPAVAESQIVEHDQAQETDLALANQPQPGAAAPPQAKPFAASQFAQSADEDSSQDELAPQSQERDSNESVAGEVRPAERAASDLRNRRDEAFRSESVSERTAPADVEAERPPAAEPLAAQAANIAVAPPPPAAPEAPQAEAEAGALRDRTAVSATRQRIVGGAAFGQTAAAGAAEQRKSERAELAQAPQAAPPSQPSLARRAALEKISGADGVFAPERGFTVLPAALEDPAVDVGVAADGWISIRAVDANSGTITITDVYVP